jgi:hypothetical protein
MSLGACMFIVGTRVWGLAPLTNISLESQLNAAVKAPESPTDLSDKYLHYAQKVTCQPTGIGCAVSEY